MTERQAWLKLAAGVRDDIAERDSSGLCFHLWYLNGITPAMRERMGARISSARKGRGFVVGLFVWPLNRAGNLQRIAFCRRQVARIDRERRKRRAR